MNPNPQNVARRVSIDPAGRPSSGARGIVALYLLSARAGQERSGKADSYGT